MLPYLELQKDNENEEKIPEVEVPEIRLLNLKDAKNALREVGLELRFNREIGQEEKEEEIIIKEQLPKPRNKSKTGF